MQKLVNNKFANVFLTNTLMTLIIYLLRFEKLILPSDLMKLRISSDWVNLNLTVNDPGHCYINGQFSLLLPFEVELLLRPQRVN